MRTRCVRESLLKAPTTKGSLRAAFGGCGGGLLSGWYPDATDAVKKKEEDDAEERGRKMRKNDEKYSQNLRI